MRSIKNILLASALTLAVAAPALASNSGNNGNDGSSGNSGGTFTGSLNGGFTTGITITGSNNFGTEGVGSISSTLSSTPVLAQVQGSSYAISGGISAVGANGVGTLSGGVSNFNVSGSAQPGAIISGTADSFSEGVTGITLTDTTYGNGALALTDVPVADLGLSD